MDKIDEKTNDSLVKIAFLLVTFSLCFCDDIFENQLDSN